MNGAAKREQLTNAFEDRLDKDSALLYSRAQHSVRARSNVNSFDRSRTACARFGSAGFLVLARFEQLGADVDQLHQLIEEIFGCNDTTEEGIS